MTDLTDTEFLYYVETHCNTDRALFHRSMVERLLVLAGDDPDGFDLGDWITLPREVIESHGWLKAAWAKVRGTK